MNTMLFDGPLAVFFRMLIRDSARPVRPLPELLQEQTLDQLLMQVYGPELVQDKRPVLVSQWFKFYAMQLIPPVVVAGLVHGVSWPLQLSQVGFALHERGFLDGLRLEQAFPVASPSDNPFERFAPLLENLQQVIGRLSAYGGVMPGVLWSTAGDYLETCLRQLAEIGYASAQKGYGLLHERLRPDGRRNALFNTILYMEGPDGSPIRQRRRCCLSYQVEWAGRCEHCPLTDSA